MKRILGIVCLCFAISTLSSACFFSFDVGCADDTECPAQTTCDENGLCQPDPEAIAAANSTNGANVGDRADSWSVSETPGASGPALQACTTWWECPYNQVCEGARDVAFCVAPENCVLSYENAGDGTCGGSLRCANVAAEVSCTYNGNISTCSCLRENGTQYEFVSGGSICEDSIRLFDKVNAHCKTRVFPNDAPQ